ncbi:MAG: putative Ig domain-containing protein, partial [Bdellovibrionales bacterium]|nr:putative Ig domain-containing protein [Bdellovibrionales bacterium]
GGGTLALTTFREVQVATEADYQFFQDLGSSVSAANAEILSILNGVDAIYESELGLTITVTFQHVVSSASNPYTSSDADTLLDQFQGHWNVTYGSSLVRDVAHLFTGKTITSPGSGSATVGLAFYATACDLSFAYGLSEYQSGFGSSAAENITLTAHEIGHNIGALHDSCSVFNPLYVMCPTLSESTIFSTATKSQISNYIASVSCLSEVSGNTAPQFIVDPGTQSLTEGVTYSLQLQATDAENDPLLYSVPAGLPAGASLDPSSGLFTWKPDSSQSGQYSLTFRVADPSGASDELQVLFQVANNPSAGSNPSTHVLGDFTGQGRAYATVYRHVDGIWYSGNIESETSPGTPATDFSYQQWGLPGDVAVLGDYNGDNITDRAVFRRSANTWYIRISGTGALLVLPFGLDGDLPTVGDFDGDGRDDVAVYRPSAGQFIYRSSADGVTDVTNNTGEPGEIPVPCDYDGDSITDFATFHPEQGMWTIRSSSTGTTSAQQYGLTLDLPVPGDYDGDGECDIAVWRPSSGEWFIFGNGGAIQYGLPGDVPAPLDFDGDGTTDIAVWRSTFGLWFLRTDGGDTVYRQLGLPYDTVSSRAAYRFAFRRRFHSGTPLLADSQRPLNVYSRSQSKFYRVGASSTGSTSIAAPVGSTVLTGDYNRDNVEDVAVFSAGLWTFYYLASNGSVTSTGATYWGGSGDIPVSGDFDGDGYADVAIYRPLGTSGGSEWYIISSSTGFARVFSWGLSGDVPIPGDFNGDGVADPAVWRPATGTWYVIDGRSGGVIDVTQWGLPGDLPRLADVDRDGRPDKIVYRPSAGVWYISLSGGSNTQFQFGTSSLQPAALSFSSSDSIDFVLYRVASPYVFARTAAGQQVQVDPSPPIASSGSVLVVAPFSAIP